MRIPVIQKKNHNNKAEKKEKKDVNEIILVLKKRQGKKPTFSKQYEPVQKHFFSGQTSDRSGCPTMS